MNSTAKILAWVAVVFVMLAVWFGVNCLISLLATWVFFGFGLEVPFWPIVGAVFLLQLVLGWLSSAGRKNS